MMGQCQAGTMGKWDLKVQLASNQGQESLLYDWPA